MKPEDGRSAILAAARAIARTPLGRLDAETTCNVGLIGGGSVRNAVPARATVDAEARSLDDAKLDRVLSDLREHWESAAAEVGCTVEITTKREYRAYRLADDDFRMTLAREGAALAGRAVQGDRHRRRQRRQHVLRAGAAVGLPERRDAPAAHPRRARRHRRPEAAGGLPARDHRGGDAGQGSPHPPRGP